METLPPSPRRPPNFIRTHPCLCDAPPKTRLSSVVRLLRDGLVSCLLGFPAEEEEETSVDVEPTEEPEQQQQEEEEEEEEEGEGGPEEKEADAVGDEGDETAAPEQEEEEEEEEQVVDDATPEPDAPPPDEPADDAPEVGLREKPQPSTALLFRLEKMSFPFFFFVPSFFLFAPTI